MNSGIKLSYNSQIQKKKYFIYLIKGPKTKKVHFILLSALWGLGHILQNSLFWQNLNRGIPSRLPSNFSLTSAHHWGKHDVLLLSTDVDIKMK